MITLISPSYCYVKPHYSEGMSFGETSVRRHDLIAHTTERRPQKKLRRFLHKDLPDEESSPLCLRHASKEAKLEPPSFAHFNENNKSPQEALQSNGNVPGSRWTPATHGRQRCPTRMEPLRHARRWQYHIPFKVF